MPIYKTGWTIFDTKYSICLIILWFEICQHFVQLSMIKMIGAANETMVSHHDLAMMSAHIAHMS